MTRTANQLDPRTLPPKLRAVYEAARRLARIRAQRVLWGNLLKALGEGEAKPAAEGPKGKK